MSSISKLPKNKISWRISTLRMSKKQEIIVLIIFLWEGKAIGSRNPIGIKGMILPKIFIKATLKLKSLTYVSIVQKGTKFANDSPWFLRIIFDCIVLITSCMSPLNLITIKFSTNNMYIEKRNFQISLNILKNYLNSKFD